jgi:hypothetical protein
VLSTPPAFVLSQDQTLREITKSCHGVPSLAARTERPAQTAGTSTPGTEP